MNQPESTRVPDLTLLLAAGALALLLALTLPTLSSTRIQTWPWALFASLFWLLPTVVALGRLALAGPHSRLGGALDLALGSLALVGVLSTACSPLRETLLPCLIPFLGAIALPYALLPVLRHPRADLLASAFVYPLIIVSALLWLPETGSRNAQPFGHGNITGSVFALAACWLAGIALRARTRGTRLLHILGALAAAGLAASSASRGAVLALAAAAMAGTAVVLLRRGKLLLFLSLGVLVLGAAVLSNQRLRELASAGKWSPVSSESNAQRVAMIRGGLELATRRPVLGWGPGAVPHVFPSVRAPLPGVPDNYLQLHNGPAQTAATLGGMGLLSIAILVFALFRQAPDLAGRAENAPLLASLICGGGLVLFDHSFATPAFAVLAALPIASLANRAARVPPGRNRLWLAAPGLLVVLLTIPLARDLAARATWSAAIDSAAAGDPSGYASRLARARELAPADPFYADQLASHLATGHPFPRPATPGPSAIPVLRESLSRNAANEAAHYNLGWLLLAAGPSSAKDAADHFTAAALLAPRRGEVYLGLALARIAEGDTSLATSALAAEILLDPTFARSPRWREPAIARFRDAALVHAAEILSRHGLAPDFAALLRSAGPALDASSAYRRLRTGHGVLFGHPDGPAPADVNIRFKIDLPPASAAALPPTELVAPSILLSCAGLAPRSGSD